MKELVNLVVNILTSLSPQENISLSKKEDGSFVFEGFNRDSNGTPYKYKMVMSFEAVEEEQHNDDYEDEKVIELMKKMEEIKKRNMAQPEQQILNEGDKDGSN